MRILLIVFTLLFSACQTNMYGPDVPSELAANLKLFEDTVRWGNLENMYFFVDRSSDSLSTGRSGRVKTKVRTGSSRHRFRSSVEPAP
jgi:hypothetical protein